MSLFCNIPVSIILTFLGLTQESKSRRERVLPLLGPNAIWTGAVSRSSCSPTSRIKSNMGLGLRQVPAPEPHFRMHVPRSAVRVLPCALGVPEMWSETFFSQTG